MVYSQILCSKQVDERMLAISGTSANPLPGSGHHDTEGPEQFGESMKVIYHDDHALLCQEFVS